MQYTGIIPFLFPLTFYYKFYYKIIILHLIYTAEY